MFDVFYSLRNKRTGRYFHEFKNRRIVTTYGLVHAMKFNTVGSADEFIIKNRLENYEIVKAHVEFDSVCYAFVALNNGD